MDNHTLNLIDFTEEKNSQVGVIVRDYHVVNEEEKNYMDYLRLFIT